ncbi:MAG TPA: hypothetical protein VFP34_14565 [Microlunatus sp.]|nr:hypothetical protein [Microlunatus sp.]
MAKRPSKHVRAPRPLNPSLGTSAVKHDGRWVVRSITGQATHKSYRCPSCSQIIQPGTPHVVAWPADPPLGSDSAVAYRRHWHTGCWQRRP